MRFLLSSCAGLALSLLGATAQAECLKANAGGQMAEGRLRSSVFSIPDYKLKEQAYILELTTPACLDGDDDFDKVDKSNRIHVYAADDKLRPRLKALVGKAVRVKGTPFGEETAHHHAPIVMGIDSIEPR